MNWLVRIQDHPITLKTYKNKQEKTHEDYGLGDKRR